MDLPMMVSLTGRLVVVIGGGQVALRRTRAFVLAGADVCVIAPEIVPELGGMPITRFERPYQEGDLEQAFLVVVATNDPATNEAVAREARRLGVLINRTDRPELGDVAIPAHAHWGPLTVAVHTGGVSARAAAEIRDELLEALDPHYVALLETVGPYRQQIKQRVTNRRRRREALRALSGPAALDALRAGGTRELKLYCEAILEQAAAAPNADPAA